MPERTETIIFIQKQLNRLREAGVADLLRAGKIKKLEEILDEVDYTVWDDYLGEEDLELEVDEIPEGCCLESAFYFAHGCKLDLEIFSNLQEYEKLLKKDGGELGKVIVDKMKYLNLCDFSIEELAGLE